MKKLLIVLGLSMLMVGCDQAQAAEHKAKAHEFKLKTTCYCYDLKKPSKAYRCKCDMLRLG